MKTILLILIMVAIQSKFIYAQNSTSWIRTLDGPTHNWDEASSVAVDDSGNVFVTGIDLVGSFSDIMTAKYNSSGTLQWVKTLDISSNDNAYQVVVDHSGNIIVSGNTEDGYIIIKYTSSGDSLWTAFPSSSDMPKPPAIAIDASDNIYLTGGWNEQGLLAKYNPEGEQQWINYYTGPEDNYIYTNNIAIDKADNIYVSGQTDMAFLSYALMVRKYNPGGYTIWTHTLYDPIFHSAAVSSMKVDVGCNVVFTGYRATGSNRSAYTVKYDSAGALKWIHQPIQNNETAGGHDIAVDLSKNIYVTGIFSNGSFADIFTTKYSAQGDSLWTAKFAGSGNNADFVEAMALDSLANVYITGSTRDFINGQFNINCLTIMYDSSSVQKALQQFDGNANDEDHGYAIAVDKWNNVIVTGRTADSVNSFDYLIIKYGENLTDVKESPNPLPTEFILYQNYPNPFNPSTKISWQSPVSSWQTLKVYDVLGNEVATLVDEYRIAGTYEVKFQSTVNGRQWASGIYFYRLQVGEFIQTKKMILMK